MTRVSRPAAPTAVSAGSTERPGPGSRAGEGETSEVAEAVGFQDPYHFCVRFTKHAGLSPRAFRRSPALPMKRDDAGTR